MDGSLFVVLVLSGLLRTISGVYREYDFISTRMSWPEAQSYCREKYTDLATVDTMDDVKRLINIVDAGYSGSVWIGLKRGGVKRWGWSNGDDTIAGFSAWDAGDPKRGNECGFLSYGVWHSSDCSAENHFACHSVSTGYIKIASWKTWIDAQSYCREHYTDLATIHNAEELEQIKSLFLPSAWIWLGLFLDSYKWSDNWNLFFRHWAAGEPYQSLGSGDCVAMSRSNSGKWYLLGCDLQCPFICHGHEKFIKKQVVRVKFSCKDKCTLDATSLLTAFLNVLKSMRLDSGIKIDWIKNGNEEVFHKESNLPIY